MRGGAGNDVYVVDVPTDVVIENARRAATRCSRAVGVDTRRQRRKSRADRNRGDQRTATRSANSITGNAAANVIDGGAGSDTLAAGPATTPTSSTTPSTSSTKPRRREPTSINASVSYSLAVNLENLTLTGTAATNGTGNTLANTLQGNAAANVLDGGAGADTMRGGAGNDTFDRREPSDVVVENAGRGRRHDAQLRGVDAGANVENLTLVGTSAMNGTGNAVEQLVAWQRCRPIRSQALDGQDLVFGGAGNDTLSGGNGRDILQGGDGNDASQTRQATTSCMAASAPTS